MCAPLWGSFGRTITLTEKYPFVYGAVGVHPDDADKMTEQTLNEIRELSRREKILAIGEIGLDYYWHKEEAAHEIQKKNVPRSDGYCQRRKASVYDPQQRCCKGYS